jgi:hypothetical protein
MSIKYEFKVVKEAKEYVYLEVTRTCRSWRGKFKWAQRTHAAINLVTRCVYWDNGAQGLGGLIIHDDNDLYWEARRWLDGRNPRWTPVEPPAPSPTSEIPTARIVRR